eukprot:248437-Rhodomonas_salina.1
MESNGTPPPYLLRTRLHISYANAPPISYAHTLSSTHTQLYGADTHVQYGPAHTPLTGVHPRVCPQLTTLLRTRQYLTDYPTHTRQYLAD